MPDSGLQDAEKAEKEEKLEGDAALNGAIATEPELGPILLTRVSVALVPWVLGSMTQPDVFLQVHT